MELNLATLPGVIWRYLLLLRVTDLLDILILVFLIYALIRLMLNSRASLLLRGLFVFFVVLVVSSVLQLHAVNYILSLLMQWGVLALIILFQPEIRRVLEQMGSRKIFSMILPPTERSSELDHAIAQTVVACNDMSISKTGALIVFEREIKLDDIVRSGTVLDAEVSSELLKNIFFVKAPMHDGAVIVRNGRVLAAGCMLPLTRNENLSRDLGMRHRAGIGMSENSDAIVVIVSEETGGISVANGGMLRRHLKQEILENILRNELISEETEEETPQKGWLPAFLRGASIGGDDDGEE